MYWIIHRGFRTKIYECIFSICNHFGTVSFSSFLNELFSQVLDNQIYELSGDS